ncbi:RNA polymerase ECF-subfamily sigma factor [Streptomyces laurentii]|uniref:RNA polymerase sigma factor n=1 Tax=Streptomyces laurentii TaxID=39478 RepID=A0A160P873_STRLU|nr:RNA polymerase ECF-subfamily sigma factor [Streptomyces laurentii]
MKQGMAAMNGTELVRAAQSGDPDARDRLVGTHLPLVYNIVGRALNGHHDVDDVVQETMLRALDGLGSLRSPDSFRSWLVAITMNTLRAHWHRQKAGQATDALDDARDLAHPGADFVELTVARLHLSGQRRETAQATRWLAPEDSALLSLWWLECAGEVTRHEVAAALELTPEHTAVRVQRMKEQLETARIVVRALGTRPLCPDLRTGLAGWDGHPSALWRKRIARHARTCPHCAGLWNGLVPAEGLLAGLLLVPPAAALLAGVRERAGLELVASAGTGAGAEAAGYETTGYGREQGNEMTRGHETISGARAGAREEGGARHAAGSGPRGSRRKERERKRGRRRAVAAAGIAVVAVAGGSLYLTTTPRTATATRPTRPAPRPPTSPRPRPPARPRPRPRVRPRRRPRPPPRRPSPRRPPRPSPPRAGRRTRPPRPRARRPRRAPRPRSPPPARAAPRPPPSRSSPLSMPNAPGPAADRSPRTPC